MFSQALTHMNNWMSEPPMLENDATVLFKFASDMVSVARHTDGIVSSKVEVARSLIKEIFPAANGDDPFPQYDLPFLPRAFSYAVMLRKY